MKPRPNPNRHPLQECARALERTPPATIRVMLYLVPELDATEFRPVKQLRLQRELELSQPAVSIALRVLRRRGVLEQGPKDGQIQTFRIQPEHPMVAAFFD